MKFKTIAFLLAFLSFSCSSSDDSETEDIVEHIFTYQSFQTVQYRNDITVSNPNLISYNIYYDNEVIDLKPVVIWIHGGGWSIGDKTNQIQTKKAYFESLGYILVSVNYRLSPANSLGLPNDILNPDRIKLPIHPEDVASAVNHIYNTISNYNGDKNNMVILGHSAGAHLAMLVATDTQYLNAYGLNPDDVFKGVANFDTGAYNVPLHLENQGITNFATALNEINNYANGDDFDFPSILYLNAFGNTPNDWINASPINFLNTNNKPSKYFIYYRGDSNTDRRDLIRNFIDELDDDSDVISNETFGLSHADINTNIGLTNNEMTTALTLFLENCFN